LVYFKSHKQIKSLVKEMNFNFPKVKYLEKAQQIAEVQKSLDLVWCVPHFQERNCVIDFLTADFKVI